MGTINARPVLLVLSILLAVLEIADGFRLSIPWGAWVFALLLLGGTYWLWRTSGIGPPSFWGRSTWSSC